MNVRQGMIYGTLCQCQFDITAESVMRLTLDGFILCCIMFYRTSICEGGLGNRNSVCLSLCPSVCHTRGL